LSGEALHPIDPLILSQTRTSFSLLVLLPLLVGRRGWQRIKLPLPDLIQCLVLGMLGVAASNYFYYVAIQRTSVAIAIIVQYTAPVWVLLYVVARGQQKLSLQKVAAVGVAITGIALTIGIVGAKSASPLRLDSYGFIAALLASFSFAFYNVGGHRILARYDRWRVLVWTLISASAFWLFVNPPWKVIAAHYAPAQWGFLFIFSMISVLGSVLSLLPGSATSRAHARDYRQLPGAGILDPAGGPAARRSAAPDPNVRNCAGAVCDRDRATAWPRCKRPGERSRG
jgi:drug/metabolite transporter (DMT)-like permease